MTESTLPPEPVMVAAFYDRDPSFDGVFFTGVRTTGIFCRPTCSARKPKRENISFYPNPKSAVAAGYRACKRCRPLETSGSHPEWLRPLLDALEADPSARWRDRDLRQLGLSPERVRRWFKTNHGMTFQAYSRARRLGSALGSMQEGKRVASAAFESGYESLSGFNEAFRRYFGDAPTSAKGDVLVHVDRIATPLGPMLVATTDDALCLLEFVDRRALPTQVQRIRKGVRASFVPGRTSIADEVEQQLDEYFAGERHRFDLPLLTVGTSFQKQVWEALRQIEPGTTTSYGTLAASIGRPNAVRAIGKANGENAIAIVIPCHRVIGADGKMVGYGGGVWRKVRLLELERGETTLFP